MSRDLQELATASRLSQLGPLSNPLRLKATESSERTALKDSAHSTEPAEAPRSPNSEMEGRKAARAAATAALDGEREYAATCQKLEQLMERKRRATEETGDIRALHHELCLAGAKLQREPEDTGHEEDYLAVLRRVKEALWHKLEAEDLRGEFQKLHFELLSLGHRLGFEQPRGPAGRPARDNNDAMSIGDVDRQIAELRAQIKSLHEQSLG